VEQAVDENVDEVAHISSTGFRQAAKAFAGVLTRGANARGD
jgi:hypothetical protein